MENLMERATRLLIPALLLLPFSPLGTQAVFALQEVPRVAIPAEARTAPLDQLGPVSPDVRVGKFENGLAYYIRENREPENRTDLRLVVDVGSVLEDDDQLGLAHFLEHMAFNGTENFEKDELVRFMESIGMRFGPELNASTSFDETNYFLTVPMDNPDYLETAFRMLRDWADGLTLDPEEIDQERGVVIEEWRFRRGAAARVRDLQYPILFRDSRYMERIPIGTVESLQTFDHEVLRRFYEEWYRPDLMAVIVVGDFDAGDVEALMREHIETLPRSQGARERVLYEVPSHSETLYSIVTDPEITTTEIAVYHKMERVRDWTVGGYRQQIVESLYNAMLNERLSDLARRPDAPFLAASSGQGKLIRTNDVYALSLQGGNRRLHSPDTAVGHVSIQKYG
jgi:zinc protease